MPPNTAGSPLECHDCASITYNPTPQVGHEAYLLMALADMANQEVTADQIQDVVEQQEQVRDRVWTGRGWSGCRMEGTWWSSRSR